jgi:hypothetical protein
VKAAEDVAPVEKPRPEPAVVAPELKATFRPSDSGIQLKSQRPRVPAPTTQQPQPARSPQATLQSRSLDDADRPVPLCNTCGEPLNHKGQCISCRPAAPAGGAKVEQVANQGRMISAPSRIASPKTGATPASQGQTSNKPAATQVTLRPSAAAPSQQKQSQPVPRPAPKAASAGTTAKPQVPRAPLDIEEIIDLTPQSQQNPPATAPPVNKKKVRKPAPPKKTVESVDPEIQAGEEEFWNWTGPK